MQVSHAPAAVSACFDDANLVSCAGLVPVVELAQRCGLADLVADTLTLRQAGGVNAWVKVPALVAGMVAGADSIADMDLLRHGAMARLFTGVRAPSTLGTFLRAFSFGHVRQLDAVAATMLSRLAERTPLLPAAGVIAFLDIDDTIKATYGYTKQGAGYGYTGVKGINALLATLSTPAAAPVIAATRLRKGSANSARGAARLVADALVTAARAGADPSAGSLVIVRADSAYYGHDVIAAARRHGARFSITARQDPAVRRAIVSIPDDAWTPIHYPNAIWDDDHQRLISDAEVAEIAFTAFTSRAKRQHVHGRLIVRRVRDANPAHVHVNSQGELFAAWRHHAVFTDSPMPMLEAESAHRAHAIIEQVIADLKNGPLAHLPSSSFNANGAWLVLAAIAFNLTRAAGCLASTFHARAAAATIRRQLISVPARIARSARRITLHLPTQWPWAHDWQQLFDTLHEPPATAR
ncbi:MAG TPA: IS1380 family transposase [Mycobacterium sp.]